MEKKKLEKTLDQVTVANHTSVEVPLRVVCVTGPKKVIYGKERHLLSSKVWCALLTRSKMDSMRKLVMEIRRRQTPSVRSLKGKNVSCCRIAT